MEKWKHLQKRTRLQAVTWIGLPMVVLLGWFIPWLGFLLLGCMVGAVGIAFYRGRAWCDWMCPRGSFYDLFFSESVTPKRTIPNAFKNMYIRIGIIAFLFFSIGIQWFLQWGDWRAMGLALVKVLTFTTFIGILFAWRFHPRTWCMVCPMGTFAKLLGRSKQPLELSDSCVQCGVCAKTCPIDLEPYLLKEKPEAMTDCIKCSTCITSCPKKSLSYRKT